MNCRLCNCADSGFFRRVEIPPGDYYRCLNCGYIQQHEEQLLALPEEKTHYGTHQNTIENRGYVEFLEKFIACFSEKLPDVRNALDFGCGPGPVLSQLLEKRGLQVDNFDPLFFPNNQVLNKKYDLITCCECLEHFYFPLSSLEKIFDCKKASGIVAVRTEFVEIENFSNWYYQRDPTHVGFFGPQSLQWVAENFELELQLVGRSVAIFK